MAMLSAAAATSYPPLLTAAQLDVIASAVKDWSIAHGLAVRPSSVFVANDVDPHMALATTAPVTLFPSLFPRKCFDEARAIQTAYNELYARISADEAWLEKAVTGLLEIDDFIANLWQVHLAVKKEGYAQDLTLGLFRSDYMLHLDPETSIPIPTIRQVEFNTIASSFGGLSTKVTTLHRYLEETGCYPPSKTGARASSWKDNLPLNESSDGLARGLAEAHKAYGGSKSDHARKLCILVLIQDQEHNVFDQKHIEYALQQKHGITVFRLRTRSVLAETTVDNTTRALLYTDPIYADTIYEVTTVYMRAWYSPDEYLQEQSPTAWQSRLHLERSAAIKCPTVLLQLAGSKKVQQILATPGSSHVANFLRSNTKYASSPGSASSSEAESTARLQRTFAPMYPLDESAAGLEARMLALDPKTAKRFVLKPQREGGGNNIYRGAIPGFLRSIPEHTWPAYILMEMIETPKNLCNTILRNGETHTGPVISELGVYGTCLWRHPAAQAESNETGIRILANTEAGYLLRTKFEASEEGGVAAGFGSVDSCLLYDE